MPRLQFELVPVGLRPDDTVEDYNARVVARCAEHTWLGPVAPCDCGYMMEGLLCGCRPADREKKTPEFVRRQLEYYHRTAHERALRSKRVFPGPPHDGKGTGWCRWCGAEIIDPKTGQRHRRRTWCAHGDCLGAYYLHTDHGAQRRYLEKRDGPGCRLCGAKWTEVDHRIPLGAAWEAFPDPARRRWFFSPANLQLLCTGGGCHNAKTRDDVAFIKACQINGEAWAKAEVLRRLSDAGLLRIARPKGATDEAGTADRSG